MKLHSPNIILLTVDSLRADRLGYYGYQRPVSPNIDKFARTGTLFNQAFSDGPNTPHAFPAIMAARSSLLSRQLGLFDHPFTLAETLRNSGYHTIAFNAGNPYVSGFFDYDRGFDDFFDYINFKIKVTAAPPVETSNAFITIPGLDIEHYLVTEENIRAKAGLEMAFTDDICQHLQSCGGKPLFLWAHFMDTHYPYLPQALPQQETFGLVISKENNYKLNRAVRANMSLKPDTLQQVNLLYDACIKQLDEKIGQLFHFFQTHDLFENSLVILCADHGEEFMDHGDLLHKSKLYDELIRVPLLVKMPGQTDQRKEDQPVSLLQLAPTILEVARTDNPFQTESLFSPAEQKIFAAASVGPNQGTPVDNHIYATDQLQKVYACRSNNLKLIFNTDGRKQFFNLLTDPNEQKNLYNGQQSEQRVIEKRLGEYVCQLEEQRVKESVMRSVCRLSPTGDAVDAL